MTSLVEGPSPDELDQLRGELDLLRARLRSLEARRAGLVAEVLQLAATRASGAELTRRLEALVDQLVSLDLRHAPGLERFDPVPATEPRSPAAPPALDAVVAADGSLADLRRCMLALETRTPGLRSRRIVACPGGPTIEELETIAAGCDGWTIGSTVDPDEPSLAAAILSGDSPAVAVLSSRVVVTHGWDRRLDAALSADDDVGAVVPLSDAAGDPASLALPPRPKLGPDGIALLVELARLESPGPLDSLRASCCVLRRRACDGVLRPADGPTIEETLEAYGEQLRRAGWAIGVGARAFAHVEPPAATAPARQPGRRRGGDTTGRSPAWTAAVADLVRECAESPAVLGNMLQAAGGRSRIAFVAETSDAGARVASLEVIALRQCALTARLVLVGDEPAVPWPDTEYVTDDSLDAALEDVDFVIVTGRGLAGEALALGQRVDRPTAYLVTEYDARPPTGVPLLAVSGAVWERLGREERKSAVALPPMFNDRTFHPQPDAGETDSRFTVLVQLRPNGAADTLRARDGIAAALGERGRVLTVGPPAEVLVARGCPAGGWIEDHHVPAGGAALAQLLNTTDVYVDVAADDRAGRDVLAAMSCGAVPVVAEDSAGVEIGRGGRAAEQLRPDDPDGIAAAVASLATDWPRFRTKRLEALAASAQHGLTGATACLLASVHELYSSQRTA